MHDYWHRNSLTTCDCTLDDGIYVASAPSSHCANLALLPSIPLISPRMVNYHDPVVVARDFCASTFAAKYASSWSQLTSLNSDIIEGLACRGWTLFVCLPCRSKSCPLFSQCIESSGVSFSAGSLSLLSIMSGVSSEGIAPSVGRYGWVAMRAFCWAFITALSDLLICPLR
jgi:hypothetical protein